ncbi:hypothetical protein C810_01370 [Lachnospiraceae bacterium A2]|nr:hypothetical protein C810_01370 [Lachnospiraceae bacterium A2]
MNRQQRRYAERKNQKYKTATYNLTKSQLDNAVKDSINSELEKAYQDGVNEGVNQAMILLLTLPLEVLMDFYWKKSYAKKIPEFTQHVLDYYTAWQNGELDMDKLKEDLWERGGVRLEESGNGD